MMDSTALIDQLSAVLMEAYQALYVADQEGPLGEKICATLEAVQEHYFTQAYEAQQVQIQRLARPRPAC